MSALVEDLENLNFNCAVRREEESKDWQLLIGLNDQEWILREAETQVIMIPRVYSDSDKNQSKVEKRSQ